MAQIKRFRAKRTLALDCGHRVKAGERFGVTKLYTCESCQAWLQSELEERRGTAISKPPQEVDRPGPDQQQPRERAFLA